MLMAAPIPCQMSMVVTMPGTTKSTYPSPPAALLRPEGRLLAGQQRTQPLQVGGDVLWMQDGLELAGEQRRLLVPRSGRTWPG
jgi:hypothetical protein